MFEYWLQMFLLVEVVLLGLDMMSTPFREGAKFKPVFVMMPINLARKAVASILTSLAKSVAPKKPKQNNQQNNAHP
jgi:hypothetical protein